MDRPATSPSDDRTTSYIPGAPGPGFSLSVIIPAYNERGRLGGTLDAIQDWASRAAVACEVVVVDDASTDGTGELVTGGTWPPLTVRLLRHDPNRGKGFSVRTGMLAATGRNLLMCDADQSAPIAEVEKLLPWLDRGFDVVIGSRDMPDSVLDPPQAPLRRLMAWAFRSLRRRLLLPGLRDTQCGFKLFRADVARAVFSRQTVNGWVFDCEVLGLAERLGHRIKEVGILWRNHPHSRVRPLREAVPALKALRSIHRRLKRHVS
jgi:dolichyl-phosphate beta-glucosyltransferase